MLRVTRYVLCEINMSNGLGRGLGSLIPKKTINTTSSDTAVEVVDDKSLVKTIKISDIVVNELQPRKKFTDYKIEELSDSIKEFGIIQPLLVHKNKKGEGYELIAGERRLRASKKAGLTEVPVILREVDDLEKLEVAIIENLQRENLNSIDLATSYKKLIDDFGMTQEDVAKKMSKSRPSVANTLRLLSLPEEIKQALVDERITEGHAKYLLSIENEVQQMELFRKILLNKMSVADTGKEVKKKEAAKKDGKVPIIDHRYDDKIEAFKNFFGAKVNIKKKGKGGQVLIDFYSDEELRELVDKLN